MEVEVENFLGIIITNSNSNNNNYDKQKNLLCHLETSRLRPDIDLVQVPHIAGRVSPFPYFSILCGRNQV